MIGYMGGTGWDRGGKEEGIGEYSVEGEEVGVVSVRVRCVLKEGGIGRWAGLLIEGCGGRGFE